MKLGLIGFCICFVISVVIAPFVIKMLKKLKYGQSILIYVEQHKTKSGTPTMGGIIFILAGVLGYFLFYKQDNILSTTSILSLVGFGVIGFLDDYIKIKYKQNEGLKPYQKIIGQLGISIIIAIFIYMSDLVGTTMLIPFTNIRFDVGYFIIPIVIIFYIAVVNSVNLIDGLDGLCGGVSSIVLIVIAIVLAILSSSFNGVISNEYTNLITSILTVAGGVMGYLCYNCFPARVFMGDTGSLALGGFIASIFALTNNYLLLLIIGIMFVLTTLSVIIQVFVYKATKKRVFKMSPLHHHFEQSTHEAKVVSIYVIVTIVVGLLTIFMYL